MGKRGWAARLVAKSLAGVATVVNLKNSSHAGLEACNWSDQSKPLNPGQTSSEIQQKGTHKNISILEKFNIFLNCSVG